MQYNTPLQSQSIRMPLFWTLFFPTGPWRHQIAICRDIKSNRPVLYMYKLAKVKPDRLENVHIDIRRQENEIHYKINETSGTETRHGINKPHPRQQGPPYETDNLNRSRNSFPFTAFKRQFPYLRCTFWDFPIQYRSVSATGQLVMNSTNLLLHFSKNIIVRLPVPVAALSKA